MALRVVLIATPLVDEYDGTHVSIAMDARKVAPPLGIYLIAAHLGRCGHDVTTIDLIGQGSLDLGLHHRVLAEADLIGVGATSFSWPAARLCIRKIKELHQDKPLVVGGIHATMFDSHILRTTDTDLVIRGEGEHALEELCTALEFEQSLHGVTGLSWRDSGKIVRNPITRMVDLDDMPKPEYSQLPAAVFQGISIESSRGCAFDCVFCSTNYRKTYRAMDAIRFVDKLEGTIPFLKKTTHGSMHIIDDEFSLDTNRAVSIINEVHRRKLDVRLVFDSRANDLVKDRFVETVAPYVGRFLVGAECGYDQGLKMIGKGVTTFVLEKAAACLQAHGVSELCDFSFVIGFPWESPREAKRTITFAATLMARYGVNVLLQWYMQIPGSRLWEDQRQMGVLHEALYDDFGLFRNPYLFRSGVRGFNLDDFYEISELVASLKLVHTMSGSSKGNQIEYAHPLAIRRYFPNTPQSDMKVTGLNALRQVGPDAIRRLRRKGQHSKIRKSSSVFTPAQKEQSNEQG